MALTPSAVSAAAGDLDTTFGTGGKRVLPGTEQPLDVFVQPDGKIVTVGGSNALFSSFKGYLVRRALPDGSPDRSFDGDGVATVAFPSIPQNSTLDPKAAALQPDGGIVVAGNSSGTAGSSVAVARFASDGQLDRTFDEGGADGDGRTVINTTTMGFGVQDVVLQPGGRIALVGTQGNDSDFAVTRLRSDGSVDGTAFDPGDFADRSDNAIAAAQSPDGTLVVVGRTDTTPTKSDAGVVRYRSDGKLDTSLAGTGKRTVTSIDDPAAVSVQPDGKILVAGAAGQFGSRKLVVTRLTREGNVDATFGNGGTAELADQARDNAANAIVPQPDGKILVSGSSSGTPENATFDALVARYDSAGRLDPSYGSGGRVTISFGDIGLGGPAALQPDGKLVVFGLGVASGAVPRPTLARLLADPVASGGGGDQPSTQQPQPETQQPQPETQADQGGTTNTPADTVAPRVSGLRVVASGSARRRLVARFTLTEAARVRFTLQSLPRKGRPRAVRGSFSVAGLAGTARLDIARQRLVRRLAPGRYRLVATPTDAAGNRGAAARAVFTVKRK